MTGRRNTDAALRALERAALASPDDHDLAERLVVAHARHGAASVTDAVLVVARRLRGKAPAIHLVRHVSDLLGRRVSHQEVWRAIDELYERDLVDARGALVDQGRGDVHRLLFTQGDWVVTTRRDDWRERSGWITGPSRSTSWIAYQNGAFGFDNPEIVPASVRRTLMNVIDRKLGDGHDAESYPLAHPACSGCTTMHATDMVVRHPDWYDCPNVAITQARDATVAEIVSELRELEWNPIKVFADQTGEHVGWGVRERSVGARESGLVWYRGADRDPEADRNLRRRWLLQKAKSMQASRLAAAWQRKLDENWRDALAREAVERVMGDARPNPRRWRGRCS